MHQNNRQWSPLASEETAMAFSLLANTVSTCQRYTNYEHSQKKISSKFKYPIIKKHLSAEYINNLYIKMAHYIFFYKTLTFKHTTTSH